VGPKVRLEVWVIEKPLAPETVRAVSWSVCRLRYEMLTSALKKWDGGVTYGLDSGG
jgi:hypothetical protein